MTGVATVLAGTAGQTTLRLADTYSAFRGQLVEFVRFVRDGRPPYPFSHTVELMTVLIAGLLSRAAGSRRVDLAEIDRQF